MPEKEEKIKNERTNGKKKLKGRAIGRKERTA